LPSASSGPYVRIIQRAVRIAGSTSTAGDKLSRGALGRALSGTAARGVARAVRSGNAGGSALAGREDSADGGTAGVSAVTGDDGRGRAGGAGAAVRDSDDTPAAGLLASPVSACDVEGGAERTRGGSTTGGVTGRAIKRLTSTALETVSTTPISPSAMMAMSWMRWRRACACSRRRATNSSMRVSCDDS
jgi:hypothetical protein